MLRQRNLKAQSGQGSYRLPYQFDQSFVLALLTGD